MQQNIDNTSMNAGQSVESMAQLELQDCVDDCMKCYVACKEGAEQMKSGDTQSQHYQMMLDCAELCLTTVHFLEHNSPQAKTVAQACAQVTQHCGEMCAMAGMTDSANACKNASFACDQISKMVG